MVWNTSIPNPIELLRKTLTPQMGFQDEDQEGDLEVDEGFEDLSFDVPVEFMELTCNALQPIHQQMAALQPPGLSSSKRGPAESSLPETATQSQVNKYPLAINNEVLWGDHFDI